MFYPLLTDKNCHDGDLNESCLVLKPPKSLTYLFNKSKTFSSDINNNPENIINSKHYDNDKLQTLKDFT